MGLSPDGFHLAPKPLFFFFKCLDCDTSQPSFVLSQSREKKKENLLRWLLDLPLILSISFSSKF